MTITDLFRVSGLLVAVAVGIANARETGELGSSDAATPDSSTLSDLPLIEIPASGNATDTLAVIVSGDGGWVALDKSVAGTLTAQGISVVGLNSLRYFWHPHTPDETAEALERVLRYYLLAWQKQRILLIGYSRGADVMPFVASRLPDDLRARVDLVALLGPATNIAFSFRITDWLGVKRSDAIPTLPEIRKLAGLNILCVHGSGEHDSACPLLPEGLAIIDELPGGHHFGGDYKGVAERILAASGR
jgi:type IV secretory pathway VirJ component